MSSSSGFCRKDLAGRISSALLNAANLVNGLSYALSGALGGMARRVMGASSTRTAALEGILGGAAGSVAKAGHWAAWSLGRACASLSDGYATGSLAETITTSVLSHRGSDAGRGFKILDETMIHEHRSGWNYVLHLLRMELSKPDGVLLLDFAERVWGWEALPADLPRSVALRGETRAVDAARVLMHDGKLLYRLGEDSYVCFDAAEGGRWMPDRSTRDSDVRRARAAGGYIAEPYVAFFHNPPNIPDWMGEDRAKSPEAIIESDAFRESLPMCRGIFVFSQYLCDWMRTRIPPHIPISVVYHPTEDVCWLQRWDHREFRASMQIVQLGYWLRNMSSVHRLRTGMKKMWLYGSDKGLELYELDPDRVVDPAVTLSRVPNVLYDGILRSSVVLLDLHDSSCNNAIIECVARGTPAFVKRLPATEEYLGKDYPMFFDELGEVERALERVERGDHDLLLRSSRHLGALDSSRKFSGDAFVRGITSSDVYKNICQNN